MWPEDENTYSADPKLKQVNSIIIDNLRTKLPAAYTMPAHLNGMRKVIN
jgi:hypothetical protein